MSERKVLNKYYPPDFDPSKIPRMKLPKNRQYTVRLMAPFNMRCATCGEYIYKGKKFNARKEDVENEDYLGIRIYRFYIKCTRCLQEISFKTDPKNTDYEIEAGATRNFMALKLAEEQALREEEELKEEEANNPMKLLENRTKQSKNEIELLESLEELKDLNRRQRAVDYDTMLLAYDTKLTDREREEKMRELDEEYIKTVKFHGKRKIILEEEVVEETSGESSSKQSRLESALATKDKVKSTSVLNKKKTLSGLVRLNRTNDNKHATSDQSERGSTSVKTDTIAETKKVEEISESSSGGKLVTQETLSGLALLGAYSGSESD
ncbi:splicing factor yju2 [Holotrichia oblita]|uniref:Splicing factor yju2 n=2 Tax=Holotrichia oblita TaxID=644536 RepID=A0ACB9T6H9_HOLOL|nr:splicing factor yju2 [Holotrichia oblita]KAI4462412.1 splicing factor yju2 [Holotrichia oblita]